jgi:hypothetical protein
MNEDGAGRMTVEMRVPVAASLLNCIYIDLDEGVQLRCIREYFPGARTSSTALCTLWDSDEV